MVSNNVSIVKYLSEETRDHCGYCKTKLGSARYGLWAFDLTVQDYQALIDRGWRRCGHYCYKPIIPSTCCPMYTIRCSADDFMPTKSQKRVMKRFNSFINSDIKNDRSVKWSENGDSHVVLPTPLSDVLPDELREVLSKELNEQKQPSTSSDYEKPPIKIDKLKKITTTTPKKTLPKNSNSTKKKQIRINKKREKLKGQGLTEDEINKKMIEKKRVPVNKNVEDFINDYKGVNAAHKLEVKVVRSSPRSHEFDKTYEQSYELYRRYQVLIHKDDEGGISKESYERFLVNSPLVEYADYGSFHQQYWIDGKLIAVGVIDILPKCVSSVYLFYDPDYSFLSLGTYSALRELYLVRCLMKTNQDLAYYYMGYYIQSCPKMRYKGAFHPSFLLCPEVCTWHPIETCLPKIDGNKRERLNENENAKDEELKSIDTNCIPVLHKRKLQLAGLLPSKVLSVNPLREYCSLVGASCSTRMILSI